MLGESIGQLTAKRLRFYEDFIDNLAASIGTGTIQFTMKGMGAGAELRITAFDEEIPIEGGGKLQLAVTAVITVAVNVVIILGIIALIYLAVIYGIPLIAAARASMIIALLLGDIDDIDEETP